MPVALLAQQNESQLIHFPFNQSVITPEAATLLDNVVALHKSGKIQQIMLYGHCDFIGSEDYNDQLSQQRINSVKKFLVGKGIPTSLFQTETAYGERKPAQPGTTHADRAMNRRVELIIQKMEATTPTANLTERIKDSAVQTSLVLENLNFEGGRHYLLQESLPILEELLKALQNNPTVVIEIQGHVCCSDSTEDGIDLDLSTRDLSVQRAKAIHSFLIEKGIDAKRLTYQGFGGSRKLFRNEMSEAERSKNRRVEIKIISK